MSLYDVLKIPKNASKLEIEKAYKKEAKIVHPIISKSSGDFIILNRAYTILKDDYKRDFYNMFGDNSINLLDSEKDSYSIVRMLNRINIIFYMMFVVIISNVLIGLPVAMYYNRIDFLKVIFSGLNLLLFIPLIRNYFRLEVSVFRHFTYLTVRYFTLSNFFLFDNWFVVTSLILVDVINIFWMMEFYSKDSFISSYYTFVINLTCALLLKYVPYLQISISLTYFILHLYFYPKSFRPLLYIIGTPLFIYFLPLILLAFNIRSKLLFIPSGALFIASCGGLIYLLRYLKSNIPTFTPKKMCLV